MKCFKHLLSILAVTAVAACGGGGGSAGDSPFGGGGGVDPAVQVANLSLTLSANSVSNSGSETVTATVAATNASNQTVAGAAVEISVDANSEVVVNGTSTDATGRITGTIGIGADRSNRTVTVTATTNGGTIVRTRTFQVVGASLKGTPVPAIVAPSATGIVNYRLLDANANPMTEVAIIITGPGGGETNGVTGSNGEYVYTYTAPTVSGNLTLKAVAGGDALDTLVIVQASGSTSIPPVNPLLTAIRSASLSANPSVVAINTETTNNQAQIRGLFLSDANAPVKNIRVRFDLNGDANSIAGTLTTGTSIVFTDPNGVASTSYVPGTRASPTDGVTVRACWDYADFNPGICPNTVLATLTVAADPVSVTIGTNNLIEADATGLKYVKRYIVQVVDSSGVAKPDVQITPSVDLPQYTKGRWTLSGEKWEQVVQQTCDNEDLNRNNTNEIYSNGAVEDANGSFNLTPGRPALEPRKADVAISFEGGINRTNTSGSVVLRIEYPQDIASWVAFNITVSASGISATEGRANYLGILPYPVKAVTDKTVSPPFELSPYGVQGSGVLLVTNPQGQSGLLCTNPN